MSGFADPLAASASVRDVAAFVSSVTCESEVAAPFADALAAGGALEFGGAAAAGAETTVRFGDKREVAGPLVESISKSAT